MKNIIKIAILFLFVSCSRNSKENPKIVSSTNKKTEPKKVENRFKSISYNGDHKTIHIIVALCDNQYQGIAPVPTKIGNGQDPKNNLYWGTAYGIKTYFKRSSEWQLVQQTKVDTLILERVVFKHKNLDYFIVADAYDGRYIKQATENFLRSSAGILKDTILSNSETLGINGNAELLAYIGHDGLMDFTIDEKFINTDKKERDVIILACFSKNYFKPHLGQANINPLVWTTSFMAPEAYTIHDAITGYLNNETNEQIRLRAAKAYHKYQKCGLNGAKRLLVTN